MLEFRQISKTFFNGSVKHEAVRDLNLTIREGEFFSLLGPSGCGKTTLLRMIAGLDFPTAGEIIFKNEKIHKWPAQKRPFHMVFQKYALFPHLTVAENIAFGLKIKKLSSSEIQSRIEEVLKLVHMTGFEERQPETLSGGQAQRVAIARALVNRPQILLLDEPLSALDQKLREHMQTELKELQRRLGLTFIHVTHDQEEALALSDRIAVLNEGKLEQLSAPEELYHKPHSLFSAQFVGPMTSFPVQVLADEGSFTIVKMGDITLRARKSSTGMGGRRKILAMVRPEKIKVVSKDFNSELWNRISGKVDQIVFHGTRYEVALQTFDQKKVRALILSKGKIEIGQNVDFVFDPHDTFLFEE